MKKNRLVFILIVVLAIAAIGLFGCGPQDPGPIAISEFAYTGAGTRTDTPTITADSLGSYFDMAIDASDFVSGKAQGYTGVSAADAEAYIDLYLAVDSGWALLIGKPVFYKENTLVAVIFNTESGTLTILTVQLKTGSVATLKGEGEFYLYTATNPDKTEFAWGEELDLTGFSIVRKGNNGSKKTLIKDTDYTIDTSSYDKNIAGNYSLPFALVGSNDFSGNISVRVLERLLTQVKIKTAPSGVKYIVGDTFDPAGLVVTKVYGDDSEETASSNEYQIVDRDGNLFTAATVLNTSSIIDLSVRIGSVQSTDFMHITVYNIAEIDLSTAAIRLDAARSNTAFSLGEDFSLDEIVIEAQVIGLLGERWFTLPATRYGVMEENEPDMTVPGAKKVRVNAKTSAGDIFDNIFTEIDITVNNPLVGTNWYYVLDEPLAPLIAYMAITFVDNQNALLYEEEDNDVTIPATYTMVNEGDNWIVTVTRDDDDIVLIYQQHPDHEILLAENVELLKINATDAVLSLVVHTPYGDQPVKVVAVGGRLTQAQIDSFKDYGKFYLTDTATEEGLITTETVFDSDAVIYCIFVQEDYSGAEFLGYYLLEGQVMVIEANYAEMMGERITYTAEKTEGVWTVTLANMPFIYDEAARKLVFEMGDDTIEFYKLDESLYAIVTITSDDEELSRYCGQFAAEKGKPLTTITVEDGTITKYIYEGYEGAPISDNISLKLTSAVEVYGNNIMNENNTYGRYERRFLFDIDSETVKMYATWNESNGSFSITDLDDNFIYMTLTFEDTPFCAKIDIYSLEILDGIYTGTYVANDSETYAELPFIGRSSDNDGNYIWLDKQGYYSGVVSGNNIGGWYQIYDYHEDVGYSILFLESSLHVFGTYNSETGTLTYNGVELDGPPAYLGSFVYDSEFIDIYDAGNAYISPLGTGNVTEVVKGDGIITITVTVGQETLTLIYDIAADTILYDENTYVRSGTSE